MSHPAGLTFSARVPNAYLRRCQVDRWLIACAAALLLTACGGGGSGGTDESSPPASSQGGSTPPPTPPPVAPPPVEPPPVAPPPVEPPPVAPPPVEPPPVEPPPEPPEDPGEGEPGPSPPPAEKPLPVSSRYAPTTVEFLDSFENGVLTEADSKVSGWLADASSAGISESGGSLQIQCRGGVPACGQLVSERDFRFNFFVQPLRVSVNGMRISTTGTSGSGAQAQLTFMSSEEDAERSPDALFLRLGSDRRVVLSWKSNAPGAQGDHVVLDQALPGLPTALSLVLDQTSFALTVSSSSGAVSFEGIHGIPAQEWGPEGSSAIGLGGRSTGSDDASISIDAVEVESLELFDGFSNDTLESTGYEPEFWLAPRGGDANEASGVLTLSAGGSTASFVSSRAKGDFNFFAQQLRFSGKWGLKADASGKSGVARFGLTADGNGTTASPSAVAVSIDGNNRLRLGWKTKRPGSRAEATNVLVDEVLPQRPTTFDLVLDRTRYQLTANWSGGNRSFSGDHGIKSFDWSSTANSALSLEAEAPAASAGVAPVVDWRDITVARGQEHFIAPTVFGPVGDGINVEETALDPDYQVLARWGLVDVTAPPFNADPTGRQDSTDGIQHAINFARENYLVTFFPEGRYRVSDTLTCAQSLMRRTTLKLLNDSEGPCVLLGSRVGTSRPTIVLAPDSPGFMDPAKPRHVINIWARSYEKTPETPQPSISYNQQVINLDVEIGEGNAGAIGIRLRGAQGSGVQESRIDATHGFAGLDGASGSGGSQAAITVIGGRYGLYMLDSQPAPTITGITLLGQTVSAILYGGRQTLSAVGVRIVVPTGATGPALRVQGRGAQLGQVSLVDSQIEFQSPAATNLAIRTDSSIYLANVYVKNATNVVKTDSGAVLAGLANGWRRIAEHAIGVRPPPYSTEIGLIQYEAPAYVDGVRQLSAYGSAETDHVEPPADLQARHLWAGDFPGWESPGAANVKLPPYSARGDGTTDDTAALQRAIDENEIVFLPKGYYKVSRPLMLHATTRLVGVSKTLSTIIANSGAAAFSDASSPSPVIQTVDDPNATTVLASLQIRAPVDAAGVFALHWRAGRNSIFRNVNISRLSAYGYAFAPGKPQPKDSWHPLVLVSDNGGGKWYDFNQAEADYMAPSYRHVLVRNTSQRLGFYQFNAEHAEGEANAEVRGSANVNFFGIKGESNYPVLWVRDSSKIGVYGYGGNASALPAEYTYPATFTQFTPSLFRIERSRDVRMVQLVDEPRVSGDHPVFGTGFDPDTWHMLVEIDAGGAKVATMFRDRPVLYKRSD